MMRHTVSSRTFWPALVRREAFLLLPILYIYIVFSTGLTWNFDGSAFREFDYFGLQAEAFLKGRSDLAIRTPLLDMSVYQNRIYLYWGPANAFPSVILKLLGLRQVNVAFLTALWAFTGVTICAFIYERVRRDYFPEAPAWLVPLFTTQTALGTPVFYTASLSYSVHNWAIALSFAAQALTILAALHVARRPTWRSSTALAFCCAAALSVRMTNLVFLPGVLLIALGTIRPRLVSKPWLRLGVPLLCIGATLAGLMLFNQARFGDPLESGLRYQTGLEEWRRVVYERNALFSPRYVPVRFHLYFLHLPDRMWPPDVARTESFPVPSKLSDLFPAGQTHFDNDNYSILLITPILLLAVMAFRQRTWRSAPALVSGLLLSTSLVVLFLLTYAWNGIRFTVDFLPGWLLLAYIGAAGCLRDHPSRLRSTAVLLSAALLWSVFLNWILADVGALNVHHILAIHGQDAKVVPYAHHLLTLVAALGLFAQVVARRHQETREVPQTGTAALPDTA